MVWWIWLILALALCVIEAATPGGFVFLFFGVAALVVGGAAAAGWLESVLGQCLAFSLLSVGALLLFRKPLLALLQSPKGPDIDTMVGALAITMEDLPPGGAGKAELRGTSWNARNSGAVLLPKGQRCRVQRVDDLTLWLVAE